MTGWQYARAVLCSNLAMLALIYLIFMFQSVLPRIRINSIILAKQLTAISASLRRWVS